MEWKKSLSKGFLGLHLIFVLAIGSSVFAGLYAFKLASFQSHQEELNVKIKDILSRLKTQDTFEVMGRYLSRAQADKALETLNAFSKDIASLEEILEVKASDDLRENLRRFQNLISQNSSLSRPEDALKVLEQKVQSLLGVARSQNYSRVESISETMTKRLSGLNTKNVAGSSQVRFLSSDLKTLSKIVKNSTLTDGEKASLQSRFESMEQEIELLSSLNAQGAKLQPAVTKAGLALSTWMLEIEQKGKNLESIVIRKQNNLLIIISSICAFLVLAWMGIAYFSRWIGGEISQNMEEEVKKIVTLGIGQDQRFMLENFSEEGRHEILHVLDELNIKLGLGNMLHTGLPFAGCLLDGQFKVTWFNQLFLDQFHLSEEEVRSEAFHWDYLRDYLNLSTDPVYEALVNKMSGIFPVKIKQDELSPSQPFEMYVTPVFANRADQVMVIFYPLVSAQEAISEQVSLATACLERYAELWNNETLDEDELRFLEKDFKINNMNSTFKSLSLLYQRIETEKSECLSVIRDLEKENDDLKGDIERIMELEGKKKENLIKKAVASNALKEGFISYLKNAETQGQILRTVLQENDDLKTTIQKSRSQQAEVVKRHNLSAEIMAQMETLRPELKKLKFDLLETRARMLSLGSHFLPILERGDESERRLALKFSEELRRLEATIQGLEKKLNQSDVSQSKLQMIYESMPSEQISFEWEKNQKDHLLKETLSSLAKSFQDEERKIISDLQVLTENLKENFQFSREILERGEKDDSLHE